MVCEGGAFPFNSALTQSLTIGMCSFVRTTFLCTGARSISSALPLRTSLYTCAGVVPRSARSFVVLFEDRAIQARAHTRCEHVTLFLLVFSAASVKHQVMAMIELPPKTVAL